MLRLADVDVKVVVAGVEANDHAGVHLIAGADEEDAALLRIGDAEGERRPGFAGDEGAVAVARDLPGPRAVAEILGVHDALPAGAGDEGIAEAD